MNNPIGMCFPDFIGLRPLGLPFCARPGRKKYRSVARMIFSCQPSPSGQPCDKRQAIQDLCRLKAEKQILFCTDTKNADLPACILVVILIWMLFFFCGIGVENVIGHFLGESPDPIKKVLPGYHSALKSGQLFFPVCCK